MTDEQMAVRNRAALERGGKTPRGGDAALGALLVAHGLVMNGGVLHAVHALSTRDFAAACEGFRFFGFDDVAALLEFAVKTEATTENEERFNADYWNAIPDDRAIGERFGRHLAEYRQFYAPPESR